MDAVKFLEEVKRMCESCYCCVDNDKVCPIYGSRNESCVGMVLSNTEEDNFREIANAVEKWSAAHPRKTRQSAFLELWPEAELIHGCLSICPKRVSADYRNTRGDCRHRGCSDCLSEFWMQEVE